MAVSIAALFVIAACTEEQVPTQAPVEFSPTEAVAAENPDSGQAAPTATVAPPTGAGDAAAGQALFNGQGCSACHSTGTDKVVGPGLSGIYARAASRTSLDADAYIEQSVREPVAFVVDGFAPIMPSFDTQLSDSDVRDLIAFLKTLN